MKTIGKMSMSDMFRLYEIGHSKMSELLKRGEDVKNMCEAIDTVMPANIQLWLNSLGEVESAEINKETMLLLHHTAHFYMNVVIGMAIELNMLDNMPLLWDKGNGKIS